MNEQGRNGKNPVFSIFDIYALALLAVALWLFVHRYLKHNPPVYPYLTVACTCLVANWLGEAGGGLFALSLLVAASFSLMGCVFYPSWRSMGGKDH